MREHELAYTWKIDGTTPDELCAVLADVEQYARWWPAVFLACFEVEAGDAGEVGRVVAVETKGFFPSVYRWSLRTKEAQRPERVEFETFGDLEGHGRWAVSADGPTTVATWTWKGVVHRPVMSTFHGLFARDQAWGFARGEESAALELARRRARGDDAREKVGAPPPPTTRSPLPYTLGVSGIVGIVAGAAVLLARRPRK
jgi:hypothetical protein